MRRSRWRALARLLVMALLFVVFFSGDHQFPEPTPPPGPPEDAPRVIVAMGDSTLSGEGAGDYEPGTDGENGDWCHRSANASVHHTGLVSIDRTINIACSGAPSAQVGLGDVTQYTEPSQAEQLALIANRNRVVAVVVAVGANDDPQFSHVLNACVQAWSLRSARPCSETVGPDWQRRVDDMVPKVVGALNDIKTVLAGAGYSRDDYSLVLQSYAAPVSPNIADGLQDLSGCPFLTEDLQWVHDTAVPVMTEGVGRAAREADVRFLDLSKAGVGHEACARGDNLDQEWFTRLTVAWDDLQHEERAKHALQESFHPNANGHVQFGRCLGEFLNSTATAAACLAGEDGTLHAATIVGQPDAG